MNTQILNVPLALPAPVIVKTLLLAQYSSATLVRSGNLTPRQITERATYMSVTLNHIMVRPDWVHGGLNE